MENKGDYKPLILLLIMIVMGMVVNSKEETIIKSYDLSHESIMINEKNDSLSKGYEIMIKEKSYSFIRINLFSTNEDNPAMIFISDTIATAEFKSSQFKSIQPRSILYIQRSFYEKLNALYIKVSCQFKCGYQLEISYEKHILIKDNQSFTMQLNPKQRVLPMAYESDGNGQAFQITIQSTSFLKRDIMKEITLKAKDKRGNEFHGEVINDDAIGLLIEGNSGYNHYTIELILDYDEILSKYYSIIHNTIHNDYNEIRLLEEKYILLRGGIDKTRQCFQLKDSSTNNAASESYILNGRSKTRNALVNISTSMQLSLSKSFDTSAGNYLQFTNVNSLICISPLESSPSASSSPSTSTSIVSFQFQISKSTPLQHSQPYNRPLYKNIPTIAYIPKGSIMYYRIHSLHSEYNNPIYLHHHSIKHNKSIMYQFNMSNYPFHSISPQDLSSLTLSKAIIRVHDINGFSYYRNTKSIHKNHDPYYSHQQMGVLVHCPSENGDNDDNGIGCEFELMIGIENEPVLLPPNIPIIRRIDMNYSHRYSFSITDPKVTHLYTFLNIFPGYGELSILINGKKAKDNEGIYHLAGKNQCYELSASDLQRETLEGSYDLLIRESYIHKGYYTIYYTATIGAPLDKVVIPSGQVVTEMINRSVPVKTYTFINANKPKGNEYVVTISAVNCFVDIGFNKERVRHVRDYTFLIRREDDAYRSGQYDIEVSVIETDSYSNDPKENCILVLMGSEMPLKEIVLMEAIRHSIQLGARDIRRISYKIPIIYPMEDEPYIIYFNKENEAKAIIDYDLLSNDDQPSKSISFTMIKGRKIIMIPSSSIQSCLKESNSICHLLISIESFSDHPFSFSSEISSRAPIPTYLQKGEIHHDYLGKQFYQYLFFYSDLAYKSSGEVVIDFKGNSGNAVAKIIPKHLSRAARVLLPQDALDDPFRYDYFNQSIVYTEKDTSECLVSGCEIFIGVYSTDTSLYFREFAIYIRDNDSPVRLYENSYAIGTLKGMDEVHYYKMHVYADVDRIMLNLDGEYCFGYAWLGDDRKKEDKEKGDWTFDGYKGMLEIKDNGSVFKKRSWRKTMQGRDFVFEIRAKGLEMLFSSFYAFKVITPLFGITDPLMPMIIQASKNHNEICETNSSVNRCIFIITLDSNTHEKMIYLHIQGEYSIGAKYVIYTKVISEEYYNYLAPDRLINALPNEFSYENSSLNQSYTDRLKLAPKAIQVNNTSLLLVTVISRLEGKMMFLAHNDNVPRRLFLHPNSKHLVTINDSTTIIDNTKRDKESKIVCFYLSIVHLEGVAIISDIASIKFRHFILNASHKTYGTVVCPKYYQSDILRINLVRNNEGNSFVGYIEHTLCPSYDFNMIKYGQVNIINHRSWSSLHFPLMYYVLAENDGEDIMINIRLKMVKYGKLERKLDMIRQSYVVKGFVTDENYIMKKRAEEMVEPEIRGMIHGSYDQMMMMGRIAFRGKVIKEYITNARKYLCFMIEPLKRNEKDMTHFSVEVIAIPMNGLYSNLPLPSDYFFFFGNDDNEDNDNKPMVFRLLKHHSSNTFMTIEYHVTNSSNSFTINPLTGGKLSDDDSIDYSKNCTMNDWASITFKQSQGRIVIEVQLKEEQTGVLFAILSKTDKRLMNYVLRYQIHDTKPSALYHDPMVQWEKLTMHDVLKVSFKAIKDEVNDKVVNSDYYINYYAVDDNDDDMNLWSIYSIKTPLNTDYIKGMIHPVITHNLQNIPSEVDFYFTITAISINPLSSNEEIFLYQPQKIISSHNETSLLKRIITTIALFLLILLILIFLIKLILIYHSYHKKTKHIFHSITFIPPNKV